MFCTVPSAFLNDGCVVWWWFVSNIFYKRVNVSSFEKLSLQRLVPHSTSYFRKCLFNLSLESSCGNDSHKLFMYLCFPQKNKCTLKNVRREGTRSLGKKIQFLFLSGYLSASNSLFHNKYFLYTMKTFFSCYNSSY